MANLISQDMTVLVHPSSRFNNNQYDEVYVRTSIVTDAELVTEYYVPAGVSLPAEIQRIIQSQGLAFRPYRADQLLLGTEDIQAVALNGDIAGTTEDAAKLFLLTALKKQTLNKVAQVGNKYVYDLEYSYKIFPAPGTETYQFEVVLPFDGIAMVNGVLKLTVITPDTATVNPAATKGTDDQGQEITEVINRLGTTGKSVTEFSYRKDPRFVVEYTHNPGTLLQP